MSKDQIGLQFSYCQHVLLDTLGDLGEEESLREPLGGSSLNWVVGHLVHTRLGEILPLLGVASEWSSAFEDRYHAVYERGTGGRPAAGEAMPWSDLLAAVGETGERIAEGLAATPSDALSGPLPEGKSFPGVETVGQYLAGLAFHEAYHVGQTGLHRRLLGHSGRIK